MIAVFSPPPDLVFRDVTVAMGRDARPIVTDVRVRDGKIDALRPFEEADLDGTRQISAKGLVLAPGFIDVDSRADRDLALLHRAEPLLRQGVTTIAVGARGDGPRDLKDFARRLKARGAGVNVAAWSRPESPRDAGAITATVRPWPGVFDEFLKGDQTLTLGVRLDRPETRGRAGDLLGALAKAGPNGYLTVSPYPDRLMRPEDLTTLPDRRDEKGFVEGLKRVGGAERVVVRTYSPDRKWEGQSLSHLAELANLTPEKLLVRMVAETTGERGIGEAQLVATDTETADWDALLNHPQALIGTGADLSGRDPGPYGAFARFLTGAGDRLFARIRRLTVVPATALGLKGRGVIELGAEADLVLLNPAKIADRATLTEPTRLAEGVEMTLVNGRIAYEKGTVSPEKWGRFIEATP